MNIKTVIIDDELLARQRIRQLLADEPEFRVVNESTSVSDGIAACLAEKIDLIFLDVQLPDGSGFDVLRQLPEEHLPAVIFVTAFDQHTIEAFDFHAVDYLLKPFSKERFHQSTSRFRQRLNFEGRQANNNEVRGLLDHIKSDQEFLTRLIVNHRERLIVVPIKDVDWITAFGNYLRVHSKGKTYLLRGTINRMEERLEPEHFLRIHRSTIVRIDCIREFQPLMGGQYTVVLKDGTKFVLSRNYRKEVLSRFEV